MVQLKDYYYDRYIYFHLHLILTIQMYPEL